MTPINPEQKQVLPMNDEEILKYLERHTDFFVRHPEILESLDVPQPDKTRDVVDFQSFMLQRLKKDKARAESKSQAIIENSRANMHVQTRINTAVIRLLDAQSFEAFLETATSELAIILDVDIITIVIEAGGKEIPHVPTSGIKVVETGVVQHFMRKRDSILESKCVAHEIVFGGAASLVQSQALQRLNISSLTPNAMIAFGSRNPEMFQPGQGTELVGFLADVIERMIRQWLQLP